MLATHRTYTALGLRADQLNAPPRDHGGAVTSQPGHAYALPDAQQVILAGNYNFLTVDNFSPVSSPNRRNPRPRQAVMAPRLLSDLASGVAAGVSQGIHDVQSAQAAVSPPRSIIQNAFQITHFDLSPHRPVPGAPSRAKQSAVALPAVAASPADLHAQHAGLRGLRPREAGPATTCRRKGS